MLNFGNITPIVKNLLIINVLFFLATVVADKVYLIDLNKYLGMFYFESEWFRPHQIITYMFMHGSWGHLFFNMFAVWMFGVNIEQAWGPKRFLIYYLATGMGAVFLHFGINFYQVSPLLESLSPEVVEQVQLYGYDALHNFDESFFTSQEMFDLTVLLNVPIVGASGAVFGILLAFGILYPNVRMFLIFFPIPIKAKYFVLGYGLMEVYLAFQNSPGDNVAHFAHLGGMLFGYLLIRYWRADNRII